MRSQLSHATLDLVYGGNLSGTSLPYLRRHPLRCEKVRKPCSPWYLRTRRYVGRARVEAMHGRFDALANAGAAHAPKGQVGHADVHHDVVLAAAARRGARGDALQHRLRAEDVQGQWLLPGVDIRNGLVHRVDGQDWQNGPEDFATHHLGLGGCPHDGGFDELGCNVDGAAVKHLDGGVIEQTRDAVGVPLVDNAGHVGRRPRVVGVKVHHRLLQRSLRARGRQRRREQSAAPRRARTTTAGSSSLVVRT